VEDKMKQPKKVSILEALQRLNEKGSYIKRDPETGNNIVIKNPVPLLGKPILNIRLPAANPKKSVKPVTDKPKETPVTKPRDPKFIIDCIRGRTETAWNGYKPLPCEESTCKDYHQCQELKRAILMKKK
jgi:hypothetical protein